MSPRDELARVAGLALTYLWADFIPFLWISAPRCAMFAIRTAIMPPNVGGMFWQIDTAAAAPAVLSARLGRGRPLGSASPAPCYRRTDAARKRGGVLGRGLRLQCGKRASLRARNPLRRHSVPRKRRRRNRTSRTEGLTIKGAQGVRQAVIQFVTKADLVCGWRPDRPLAGGDGVAEHPIPTGIFSVIDKERYHTSIYTAAPDAVHETAYPVRDRHASRARFRAIRPRTAASASGRLRPQLGSRPNWRTRDHRARRRSAPVAFAHERLFALRQPVRDAPTPPNRIGRSRRCAGSGPTDGASGANLLAPDDAA